MKKIFLKFWHAITVVETVVNEQPLDMFIEDEASRIAARIKEANNLRDTYDIYDLVQNFRTFAGLDTKCGIQITCWYDSLLLDLRRRQAEIIDKRVNLIVKQ